MHPVNEKLLDALIELVAESGEPPLEAAERMVKDAKRYRACLRAKAFPARLGSPLNKDGGYVTWVFVCGGKEYYGASENEAIDAALIENIQETK